MKTITLRDKVLNVLDAAINGKPLMDQNECEAQILDLEKSCAALRAKLPAGVSVAAPAKDNSDCLAYHGALVSYQAQLLKAIDSPAKPGTPAKANRPPTLTEKCIQAAQLKRAAQSPSDQLD